MTEVEDAETGFFQTRSHLFCYLIILATGLLVFLFVPFYILTPEQSQQAFNNGRGWQVSLDISLLVGIYFVVFAALYGLFSLTRFRQFGAFIAIFAFGWVSLSGFLFPLTVASGTDELGLAPVRSMNLISVAVLSTITALLWLSKYAKVITVFVVTFLGVAIIPAVFGSVKTFEYRSQASLRIPLSSQKNLILISLDGVPGHIVSEILQSDPALEAEFKDFKYFKNASSTAPATEGAIMGIMFGNQNLVDTESPPENNATKLFVNDKQRYHFSTGFGYSKFNPSGTKISAGQFGVSEQRQELYLAYRPAFARMFTKIGVWIVDILEYKFSTMQKDGDFYTTVLGIDATTEILDVEAEKPAILFSHFVFTHAPAVINPECQYMAQDPNWMANNQNRAGVVAGSRCGLLKLGQLIQKLKELGVYDNSILVFASDHGKIVRFYDNPPDNLKINDHKTLGVDRYKPMLMIKNAGQSQDWIEYSDRHVLLDDLAKTLCLAFDSSKKCGARVGLDLLDPDAIAPDDFYIHVAKDNSSTWRVHTMKAVKLPRNVPLLQAMRESDEIELTEP